VTLRLGLIALSVCCAALIVWTAFSAFSNWREHHWWLLEGNLGFTIPVASGAIWLNARTLKRMRR
jgi:hypothetical protein